MVTAAAVAQNARLDALGANRLGRAALPRRVSRTTANPATGARFVFLDPDAQASTRTGSAPPASASRSSAPKPRVARYDTRTLRPHRRTRHPQPRLPRTLGGAQRPIAHHGHPTHQPSRRRLPRAALRTTRSQRRPRIADRGLRRRTRLTIRGGARSSSQAGPQHQIRHTRRETSRSPAIQTPP